MLKGTGINGCNVCMQQKWPEWSQLWAATLNDSMETSPRSLETMFWICWWWNHCLACLLLSEALWRLQCKPSLQALFGVQVGNAVLSDAENWKELPLSDTFSRQVALWDMLGTDVYLSLSLNPVELECWKWDRNCINIFSFVSLLLFLLACQKYYCLFLCRGGQLKWYVGSVMRKRCLPSSLSNVDKAQSILSLINEKSYCKEMRLYTGF